MKSSLFMKSVYIQNEDWKYFMNSKQSQVSVRHLCTITGVIALSEWLSEVGKKKMQRCLWLFQTPLYTDFKVCARMCGNFCCSRDDRVGLIGQQLLSLIDGVNPRGFDEA